MITLSLSSTPENPLLIQYSRLDNTYSNWKNILSEFPRTNVEDGTLLCRSSVTRRRVLSRKRSRTGYDRETRTRKSEVLTYFIQRQWISGGPDTTISSGSTDSVTLNYLYRNKNYRLPKGFISKSFVVSNHSFCNSILESVRTKGKEYHRQNELKKPGTKGIRKASVFVTSLLQWFASYPILQSIRESFNFK